MKIVMLGHSGVGKTSYMYSMYGAMQNPYNGFTLSTQDQPDHNRFLNIYRNIIKGRYPNPTDQSEEYNFWLNFNNYNDINVSSKSKQSLFVKVNAFNKNSK